MWSVSVYGDDLIERVMDSCSRLFVYDGAGEFGVNYSDAGRMVSLFDMRDDFIDSLALANGCPADSLYLFHVMEITYSKK